MRGERQKIPEMPSGHKSDKRSSKHGERRKGERKGKHDKGVEDVQSDDPCQNTTVQDDLKTTQTNAISIQTNQPSTDNNKTMTENNHPATQNKQTITQIPDLRKSLEERSKKYSHLPVYDRQEELKKARKRQEAMSAILSDMDKQLGTVTNLTSTHMESKGVTMVPSPTPFDDPPDPPALSLDKGILNKRHKKSATEKFASQSQGIQHKDEMSEKNDKSENYQSSQKENTSEKDELSERDNTSENPTCLLVNQKGFGESETNESVNIKEHSEVMRDSNSPTSVSIVSQEETSAASEKDSNYNSFGGKFKELTEKKELVIQKLKEEELVTQEMKEEELVNQEIKKGELVTKEMKEEEQEIPFMDDAGESEDYTKVARTSNDSEDDLSLVLSSLSLSPLLQVEKIQLEPSDPTGTLVTTQRSMQGRDTIRGGNKREVRREYTDL